MIGYTTEQVAKFGAWDETADYLYYCEEWRIEENYPGYAFTCNSMEEVLKILSREWWRSRENIREITVFTNVRGKKWPILQLSPIGCKDREIDFLHTKQIPPDNKFPQQSVNDFIGWQP